MEIEQTGWTESGGWSPALDALKLCRERDPRAAASLVLAFGEGAVLAGRAEELRAAFPGAVLLGCSTAGEIRGAGVSDGSLAVTAARFGSTELRAAKARVAHIGDSLAAGAALARELEGRDLIHVFALTDGLGVNGSEFARGLHEALPAGVGVTGGLAADGSDFKRTLVALNGPPESGIAAAVGFYGSSLRVGYGSVGGWDPFGVEWLVTRSQGSVLYELDGHSALELYKTYLGEHAQGLPATGLLFPLSVRSPNVSRSVVRTLLAVVEGAEHAARDAALVLGRGKPQLAILISCVGRKLVLRQRIEEEVEAVRDVLGPGAAITGYYSYGELAPSVAFAPCELHNQTMTVTSLSED